MITSRFGPALMVSLALLGGACNRRSEPEFAVVRGRVVQDGQPVKVGTGEQLMLQFHAENAPVPLLSHNVVADGEGAFTLAGGANRGVPLGRYKIAVSWIVPRAGTAGDKLNNRFTIKTTPLICEVVPGQDLVVELGNRPAQAK